MSFAAKGKNKEKKWSPQIQEQTPHAVLQKLSPKTTTSPLKDGIGEDIAILWTVNNPPGLQRLTYRIFCYYNFSWWSFLEMVFVGQCEVLVLILYWLFFSLVAKLIAQQTGCQFSKNVDFFDNPPLKATQVRIFHSVLFFILCFLRGLSDILKWDFFLFHIMYLNQFFPFSFLFPGGL